MSIGEQKQTNAVSPGRTNTLAIGLFPRGAFLLFRFNVPGFSRALDVLSFGSKGPVAYETLLLDSMRGDATLFTRRDEVEAEWRNHYSD